FTSDGARLATGGLDSTIRFWDPESGLELFSLRAHSDRVYALAFAPNRTWLASAGDDGYIRLHPDGIPQLLATARGQLFKYPSLRECKEYLQAVGADGQCPAMAASAKTLAEANQLARRSNKISEAASLYEQVPNEFLNL